jgi:peptidoglycan/LPS O-acetylase OafA/YrhL
MDNTIASLFHGRDNNFNLIRFIAAFVVMVDHSFALVAPAQVVNAALDLGSLELGRIGVDIFFIVSGFLVTRSAMTRPTVLDYGVARFMRLFPALFVTCVAIAFLLGPIVTSASLHAYFTDPRTWLFVPVTASLITHTMTLPGVYDTLPVSGVIDQPLWTLRYEAFCYILLAAFAIAGLLATRFRAGLTLALIFAGYCLVTYGTDLREMSAIDSTTRFILGFFLGGAFYVFADKIRLNFGIVLILAGVAILLRHTPIHEAAFRLALAYGVLWFALVPAGFVRDFNQIGDYSYGLYILCFPIQQAFVMLDPTITPFALLVSSFPAVLAFAILSWHFIEHPALHRKEWVSERLHETLQGLSQRLSSVFAPRPTA